MNRVVTTTINYETKLFRNSVAIRSSIALVVAVMYFFIVSSVIGSSLERLRTYGFSGKQISDSPYNYLVEPRINIDRFISCGC